MNQRKLYLISVERCGFCSFNYQNYQNNDHDIVIKDNHLFLHDFLVYNISQHTSVRDSNLLQRDVERNHKINLLQDLLTKIFSLPALQRMLFIILL